MARPDLMSPTADPTNAYRPPDPVLVATIVDDYGLHAALERWSSLSRNAIQHIAQKGRKTMRQQQKAAA